MGEGDLETCCLGPVEFDIAHAPTEVGEHYPGADQDLLDLCRILMRAMVTAWRWDREDQFPTGCTGGSGGSTSFGLHSIAKGWMSRRLA